MRRKKLILSLVTVVLSLGFASGCGLLDLGSAGPPPSWLEENPSGQKYEEAVFKVTYDYGFHQEGKASVLLDGCSLFFEPADYNLVPLLGGDIITVYYTGEMVVQESYPGRVVITGGEVEAVHKQDATVLELTKTESGLAIADGIEMQSELPEYVISIDRSFCALSDISVGETVWATYNIPREEGVDIDYSLEEVQLAALYDYHPNYPVGIESLYPWVAEDLSGVTAIRSERGALGFAPGDLIDVCESRDEAVIEGAIMQLKQLTFREVSEREAQMEGGGYYTLTIVTETDVYGIAVKNGCVFVDGKYYINNQSFPEIVNGDTMYQFITYGDTNVLWVNGEVEKQYEDIIGKIIFKATDLQPSMTGNKFVLHDGSTDKILLYLEDEKHFWLEDPRYNGCLWEIVGDVDFSEIFEEFDK